MKFSKTPSCMIFTDVARKRPVGALRRSSIMSLICSSPRSRSHQSAPTTRAVSSPRSASALYAGKLSLIGSPTPTIASCHPVMPSEWR